MKFEFKRHAVLVFSFLVLVFGPPAAIQAEDLVITSENQGFFDQPQPRLSYSCYFDAENNQSLIVRLPRGQSVDSPGTQASLISEDLWEGMLSNAQRRARRARRALNLAKRQGVATPSLKRRSRRAKQNRIRMQAVEATCAEFRGQCAPEVSGGSFDILEQTSHSFTVNAISPCGNAVSFEIINSPSNGILTGPGPSFTYSVGHQSGADTFSLRAVDGEFSSAPAVFNINVIQRAGEMAGALDSVDAYRNTLSALEVKHLLKSVAMGGTPELYSYGLSHSLEEFVDAILNESTNNALPQLLLNPNDMQSCNQALIAQGDNLTFDEYTREFGPYGCFRSSGGLTASTWRYPQLRDLSLIHLRYGAATQAWLTMFLWQNHFSVSVEGQSSIANSNKWLPKHFFDLRDHSLGKFMPFIQKMMVDIPFQTFLDNDTNRGDTPNENFGRELLEIYTMGVYEDPVNRTGMNYSESDILPSTLAVTGFDSMSGSIEGDSHRVMRWRSNFAYQSPVTVFAGTPYEISGQFTRTPLGPDNMDENFAGYEDQYLEHVVKSHPGTARNLATKLFMTMVGRLPSSEAMQELADFMVANDFDIKATAKKIMMSSAMFADVDANVCIQSPLEVLISMLRLAEIPLRHDGLYNSQGIRDNYMLEALRESLDFTGQTIFWHGDAFGNALCGALQHGDGANGWSWLSAQSLLGLDRAIDALLNAAVTYQGFSPLTLLPPLNGFSASESEVVDHLVSKFGVSPTSEEKAVLIEYLNFTENSVGSVIPQPWSNQTAVQKTGKLAGLVKLIVMLADSLRK